MHIKSGQHLGECNLNFTILLVFKANVNEICITYGERQSQWGIL